MSNEIIPTGTGNKFSRDWIQNGGPGAIAIVAVLGLVAIYGWSVIAAFLVGMLTDTLHLVLLILMLSAIGWVVFSKRSHMLFRLISRALTGIVIKIDPIGILEDKVQQMKKRRESFGEQVTNVAGQKRRLQDLIKKNKETADQNLSRSAAAQKMAQEAADDDRKHQLELQVALGARKAGRLQNTNIGYQQLLDKVTLIYNLLTRWTGNLDFFIEDTQDQVDQAKTAYTATNSAWKAIKTGMSIIKGNADENDLYDRTMEYLANDASMKLGAIDDFERVASDFMNKIDVDNAVVDTNAMKQLEQYEQRLLTSGDEKTQFLIPALTGIPTPVPVKVNKK